MSIDEIFSRAVADQVGMLGKLNALQPALNRVGEAMMQCWGRGGKILIAGNGGSAADAMHFAEELVARFQKNRRALAAIALCDPTVLTCTANDFGFDAVFARQIEALGNEGDAFVSFSTSGNSNNLVRAIEVAKQKRLRTIAFLGKDGGKSKGMAEIELIVPAQTSALIQSAHQICYHAICQWVDSQVD